jgi:hypothetical protein
MKRLIANLFLRKLPPTDSELFSNLDESTFCFLSVLNDFNSGKNQLVEVEEMTDDEMEYAYQLVVDAALGNFSHIDRENFKLKLLELIPHKFSNVRKQIADSNYLPPPTPQRFVGWIQDVLNKTYPGNQYISDEKFGMLMVYINSAFLQGNPPRQSDEITAFESSLGTLLFVGTHKGLGEAAQIRDLRSSLNRHLAQLLMLSQILGVKFSRDNNLKASD